MLSNPIANYIIFLNKINNLIKINLKNEINNEIYKNMKISKLKSTTNNYLNLNKQQC